MPAAQEFNELFLFTDCVILFLNLTEIEFFFFFPDTFLLVILHTFSEK